MKSAAAAAEAVGRGRSFFLLRYITAAAAVRRPLPSPAVAGASVRRAWHNILMPCCPLARPPAFPPARSLPPSIHPSVVRKGLLSVNVVVRHAQYGYSIEVFYGDRRHRHNTSRKQRRWQRQQSEEAEKLSLSSHPVNQSVSFAWF